MSDLDAAVARADRYKALFDGLVGRRRGLIRRIRELQAEVERLKAYNAATDSYAAFQAEAERFKAHQQPDGGEWTWLYGFKASDGKFHTYGTATMPRRQNLYGNRLYRQRALLCEVEPVPEAADD